MRRIAVPKIIELIKQGVCFEAESTDGSMYIRIDRYVPYVCTAIHDGSKLREELVGKINLNSYERWYEEDPCTEDFISALPIVLAGRDSRFEYDLNRRPETAIYTEAWGKKVWKKSLTKTQTTQSLQKHKNYYSVTFALISKLEELFDGCAVYDIHSYNYRRWDREVPLFNIGSERIDPKFHSNIEHWQEQLGKIELENQVNNAAINDVFYGRGYNLEFISTNFKRTLVLATEIKKVYCDEHTGEYYPQVIKSLRSQLKTAILTNANLFAQHHTNWEQKKRNDLLHKNVDQIIKKVDKQLFHLVKDFELLNFVNPINVKNEKKQFFRSGCSENPEFVYRPVMIDPFQLKRELHSLEVDKINDISIQNMYESTINGYIDKIDMLASLGTERFLYNSLRYFGEPSEEDMRNARYLLHLPSIDSELLYNQNVKAREAADIFKDSLDSYGFNAKISVTGSIVSDVMILNRQKKVLINENLKLSSREIRYLVHHEIGVHMVTTMNSNLQPLKIFNVGLPINTLTQEGMAVLAEYLSGNITLKRLRKLALRVIAVNMLCKGFDFKTTFNKLVQDYGMDQDSAFITTTRVYRGGGFTKDYLYLKGFRELLNFWHSDKDISPLLVGKTSMAYYNTISELIERGLIQSPKYITSCFRHPNTKDQNPIYDYIISGIK